MDEITGAPSRESVVAAELDLIVVMIERASQYGLLAETVRSFGVARASGSPVRNAVNYALLEWDV